MSQLTAEGITQRRLKNQHISRPRFTDPAAIVAHLGAVQAQDYPAGLWAVGLRTKGATIADVQRAIAQRKIVRTWPMRGTLHFVAAQDIRWMLELMASRVIAGAAGRLRQLELDEAVFRRARRIFTKALEGGRALARPKLQQLLEHGGITTANYRGSHILGHLSQEGFLCFGPHEGKQSTFVLLDEWLPKTRTLQRDEALIELTLRYFTSHGPATVHDFGWWSGLKLSDIRTAIAAVGSRLVRQSMGGVDYFSGPGASSIRTPSPDVHLLPPFDEYLVAYKDRSAAVEMQHTPRVFRAGNGIFSPVIIVNGQVEGTWSRMTTKRGVIVTPTFFRKPAAAVRQALAVQVKRFERFHAGGLMKSVV